MKQLELHVISGALTGRTLDVAHSMAILGRGEGSDLRLHPYDDLEVSSRHAMLVLEDDQWLVRDLDSRNGTSVNGRTIGDDTPVGDGDVIGLGRDGPRLRLVLRHRPSGSAPVEEAPTLPTELRAGTAEPLLGAAPKGVPRTWLVSATLFLLIAAGGVGLWTVVERSRMEWEGERAAAQSDVA